MGDPLAWAALAALVVGTGLVAGAYPAFVLSRFRPSRVLRGAFVGGSGIALRKGLVIVQFTVSIALAVAATVAFQQLQFLRTAPLGFDQEEVVTLRLPGDRWESLKAALDAQPEVVAVTGATTRPGFGVGWGLTYEAEGVAFAEGAAPRMGLEAVDYGFVETLGLDVLAGRSFSPEFAADEGVRPDDEPYFHLNERGFVLNRTAARRLGWSDEAALGKAMRFTAYENGTYFTDLRGTVVGVVGDYHASSFDGEIVPLVFMLAKSPVAYAPEWAIVKVRPGEAARTLGALRAVWDDVHPDAPFEASFLDADLDARYEAEARLGAVVAIFASLGGLIACLGLFGLAAFAAEQRRRELGVRRVLGASVRSLVALLTRDFVALVAVSTVLAAPLAWWAARRWLDGFVYRTEIGLLPFLVVAAVALLVAVVTVGGQALRAATADPVHALRAE